MTLQEWSEKFGAAVKADAVKYGTPRPTPKGKK